MDDMEGKQVTTRDGINSFLQVDWPEDNNCYLKFRILMVKMIFKIDPSYEKYVLTNKTMGKKQDRSCNSILFSLYWQGTRCMTCNLVIICKNIKAHYSL